jgi:hypothetical protein
VLAASGHDRTIDIFSYSAAEGDGYSDHRRYTLQQTLCCRGHTGTVTHVDWALDGGSLMSNSDSPGEPLVA